MVTGIVRQFSGKVEEIRGQKVTGVAAEFKLSEDDFIRGLIVLCGFYFVLRFVTYFVIRMKITSNK